MVSKSSTANCFLFLVIDAQLVLASRNPGSAISSMTVTIYLTNIPDVVSVYYYIIVSLDYVNTDSVSKYNVTN